MFAGLPLVEIYLQKLWLTKLPGIHNHLPKQFEFIQPAASVEETTLSCVNNWDIQLEVRGTSSDLYGKKSNTSIHQC